MKQKIFAALLAVLTLCGVAGGCADEKMTEKDSMTEATETTEATQTVETVPDAETLSSGTGRYVEEVIPLTETPYSVGDLFYLNDVPAFLDASRFYVKSTDGKRFHLQSLPKSELDDFSIYGGAVSNSGDCFLQGYDFSKDYDDFNDYEMEYIYLSDKTGVTKLDFEEEFYLFWFAFSKDGRLFATDSIGKTYEIDLKTQTATLLFTTGSYTEPVLEAVTSLNVIGSNIIVTTPSRITMYNYRQQQSVETPQVLQDFFTEQAFTYNDQYDFCEGEDGSIYFVCKNGLYRYVMGGNLVEQILDGSHYHIGNPSYTTKSVLQDTDGSFLIAYQEGVVMRYYFDPTASNEITSSLKIYSLTENDTLESLINEYQIQNPSVELEYEIGMKQSDVTSAANALEQLQAELLTDEAPDVILLDGFEIDRLNDNLLDLTAYEDAIVSDCTLFDNIAEWNRDEDGWYSIACKFQLPFLLGRESDMEQIHDWESFAEIVAQMRKEDPDGKILGFGPYTQEHVLELAMQYEGNEYFTEAGLQTDMLQALLENCKVVYENTNSIYTEEDIERYMIESASESPGIYEAVSGKIAYIMAEGQGIALDTIKDFQNGINFIYSLDGMKSDFPEEIKFTDILYRYGFSEDSSSFIPICNLGILKGTEEIDTAVDFLATAFSEGVQSADLSDGLPVTEGALQNGCNTGFVASYSSITLSNDGYLNRTDVQELQQTIAALDTPIYLDYDTMYVWKEAGSAYLNDDISLEEAVAQIEKGVQEN